MRNTLNRFMITQSQVINLIDDLLHKEMLLGQARNENRLQGYRNIKSDFNYIYSNNPDALAVDILKKMYKERSDNAEIYKSNNRNDLWIQEITEKNIIEKWLPKEPSEIEVIDFLKSLIDIPKAKSSFKKFQDACLEKFGQKVDSQIILKFISEN